MARESMERHSASLAISQKEMKVGGLSVAPQRLQERMSQWKEKLRNDLCTADMATEVSPCRNDLSYKGERFFLELIAR